VNTKGRRLKRYFGLRREPQPVIGGIEFITPSSINGWAFFSDKSNIDELAFFYGENLIAKSKVNIFRDDISKLYSLNFKTGFDIKLPPELPPMDPKGFPRLTAFRKISERRNDLKLLRKPKITSIALRSVLFNEYLYGISGNVDGFLNDNKIYGWATKKNLSNPPTVWIHAEGLNPISVECNAFHNGIKQMGLNCNYGFIVNPKDFPIQWSERFVWFSFDKQGYMEIPKSEILQFPNLVKSTEITNDLSSNVNNNNLEVHELLNSNNKINKKIDNQLDLKYIDDYLNKIDEIITCYEWNK